MKRVIPFVSTTVLQDLALGIVLIPLWYVLGIRFCVFHLLALLVLLKTVLRLRAAREKFTFPPEACFLSAYILLYGLSLALNAGGMPTARAIASLNNLSFWVMGLALLLSLANAFPGGDVRGLLQAFRFFGLVSALFALFSLAFWLAVREYPSAQSLLLRILPDRVAAVVLDRAPLLQASLDLGFVRPDKLFGREFPKPVGFDVYSSTLGLTMIFLILGTLACYRVMKKKKGLAVVLILEGLAFLFSLSRIAWAALPAALLFIYLGRGKKKTLKIVAGATAGLLAASVLIIPQKWIGAAAAFRKGSTINRIALYKTALHQTLDKPVLGHGYKPRVEDFPLPIGSHSMVVGVLYKTGILGFLVFGGFWLSVFLRWWRRRPRAPAEGTPEILWFTAGAGFLSLLVWMLAEDLDAPPVAAFLAFIVVGLVVALERMKSTPPESR